MQIKVTLLLPFPSVQLFFFLTYCSNFFLIAIIKTSTTMLVRKLTIVFLGPSPKAIESKTKINKWDLIKLYKFVQSKGNHKQNEKKTREWEKIFANNVTDKGLISKDTNSSHNSTIRKKKHPIRKWAEDINRHCPKEDIQMANRHMERCSASLIIGEMQIKTTMRYHFTQVIKKFTNNKCWRGCGNTLTLLMGM